MLKILTPELLPNTLGLRLKLCYQSQFFNVDASASRRVPPRRRGRRDKKEMLNPSVLAYNSPPGYRRPPLPGTIGGYYYVHLHTELV
jgi:hypothetical protein